MKLIDNLKQLGSVKLYKQGSKLFLMEDIAEGFFYIVEGAVRLYRYAANGREVEVARLKNGDFLGEVILFATENYPVTAEALEDTEVLFFKKSVFLQALPSDFALTEFILKLLAEKCLVLNNRLEILNTRSVRQRLAQFMVAKCSKDGQCLIDIGMKKNELAKTLGITPEALSRNFKQLVDEKIIEINGKKIKILDCDSLKNNL